jgi:hypothetical protein
MRHNPPRLLAVALLLSLGVTSAANCPVTCAIHGLAVKNHRTMAVHKNPTDGSCKIGTKNGYPIPDPTCTPGAYNPTVTVDVLTNPNFRTCCLRDKVETEEAKKVAYGWYGVPAPSNNVGQSQTCELDHLVPLELGGGDSMDNIWPQCGPAGASLADRYFKQKDLVESFLAAQVKSGAMDLSKAQHAVAKDYTQFLAEAKQYCASHSCVQ